MDLGKKESAVLKKEYNELKNSVDAFIDDRDLQHRLVEFMSLQRSLLAYLDELNSRGEYV